MIKNKSRSKKQNAYRCNPRGELEEHFSITEYLGKAFAKDYQALSPLFSNDPT